MHKLISVFLNTVGIIFGVASADEPALQPVVYDLNDLIDAIAVVESGGDCNAVNKSEDAVGLLQIRKIYIDDVNRICRLLRLPVQFSYADRLDPAASRRIAHIYLGFYAQHYGLTNCADIVALHVAGPDGWRQRKTDKRAREYVEKVLKIIRDKK